MTNTFPEIAKASVITMATIAIAIHNQPTIHGAFIGLVVGIFVATINYFDNEYRKAY